jgi:hypothetical protein
MPKIDCGFSFRAAEPVAPEQDQPRQTRNARAAVLVLLMFLPFLIQAIAYLRILFQSIFVRNDLGFPEGASVYAFLAAMRTGKLYASPFDFPWNEQMYGPIFYGIGSAFAKITHGDPMLTTILARSLSLAAFLGSVGLIGYLSWRLERRKLWTAVSVVLGLACTWAIPFCASARPDALSIFFILGALAIYQVAEGRSQLIFWAGVFGALSFLTKQNTAPVLLALALDSLIARRFKNLAAMIAGSVSVSTLILSALWLRHEPFLANFTAVGHAIMIWSAVIPVAINHMRTNQTAIIPISIAWLGAGLSWRREKYRAILLAVVFGCISNVAALANTGGGSNYLTLPWLLTILLVPAGLTRIEEWSQRSFLLPVGMTLLGALLLIHQRNLLLQPPAGDLDTGGVERLEVLSDLPYLEMRSREPHLLDPFYYHQLAVQHLWSVAPIMNKIDGEEYDLVVISGKDAPADSEFSIDGYRGTSYWGADILGELMSHYQVLCEVPGSLALVPRDRSDALHDSDIARIFRQPCRATSRRPQLAPGLR